MNERKRVCASSHCFTPKVFSNSSLSPRALGACEASNSSPSPREGRGGFYMQLCTPRLVAIAVSIAASVCRINFHVSFFIAFKIIRLKIFTFCSFFRPQITQITRILLSITAAKPRLFLISQIACAANRNFSCCNRNQIPS